MGAVGFITMVGSGVFIALLLYTALAYNRLVAIKNNVSKAWADIDVLLKQRHDEIRKLVDTCAQYQQFERNTLQQVVQARSRADAAHERQDVGALGTAEKELQTSLGNLFAVGEAYPELKTNNNYVQLQQRIAALENAIADRRELYNDSVNINNVRIDQFPYAFFARLFHFGPASLLQFDRTEIEDADIKQLFQSRP